MKLKEIKKFNSITALTLLISLLFSCFAVVPVRSENNSAGMTAGSIESFELRDESTGTNVLGTILNKSKTNDIALDYDPSIYTRLNFSNVKVYISDGTSVEWETYYWRIVSVSSSTDLNVAEVAGVNKSDGNRDSLINGENIYSGDYFLRIDIKSEGIAIITVEVSRNIDMSGSLTRTFTVKVIDDSKDGEIRAAFQKGSTGESIDLNYEVRMRMTETADISISSVTGYDYSNLNANYEKTIASYSWRAEIENKTGSASISASQTGVYSDSVSSSVDTDGGTGNKTFYVKPLKEGWVDVKFTVIPGDSYNGKYKTSIQTIRLYITRVVGDIEFNPVSEIYAKNTPAENVKIRIEDFYVMVNGEKINISKLVNEGNADLTAYITVSKDKLDSGAAKIDGENSSWGTNPADTTEAKLQFVINADFLKNPYIYVPLNDSAEVKIEMEGYLYNNNDYKYALKIVYIKFIAEEDDGEIVSLKFQSGGELVYSGKSLKAEIDKDGNAKSDIILDSFEVEVYDSGSPATGYKRRLNSYDYNIKSEADKTDIVNIGDYGYAQMITITPLKAGNVKIKVTAETETQDGISFLDVVFTVNSSNIGILPADEGKVLTVNLKRDNKNQKIYTGDDKTVYIKDGVENYGALTINIDKVIVSANNASSGYKEELQNYEWVVSHQAPNYPKGVLSGLSVDNMTGRTDNGKADIKIGTEQISGESGAIVFKIKVIPQVLINADSGEEVYGYEYDEAKSLEVSFKIIVNEIGGKFMPEIDFFNEKIIIMTSKLGDNKGYYDFNGEPEYMYCLKAADDGASQSSELWMPFMGSSMDVSKLIPKSGTTPYRIAIREINAEAEEDGNYSSDNRKTINLYPRRVISASEKKAIVYKDEQIIYNGIDFGYEYIYYKIGICDFAPGKINSSGGINVPLKSNPLGNVVTIKFAALIDYENQENNRFASAEFKIKVPKAGKMPAVKDDKKKKYSGFTNKMIWSPTGGQNDWDYCSKGAILYENLDWAFPGLETDESGDFYNLYLKTAETSRAYESDILIVKIPADKYDR